MDIPEKLPLPDFSSIKSNKSRKNLIERNISDIKAIDKEIEEIERRIRILEK